MQQFSRENNVVYGDSSVHPAKVQRKRKKKKGPKRLYDQYLADSGSDNSGEFCDQDAEQPCCDHEEFCVGMDINILIQQTLQNIVQSVSLEDCDGLSNFGDFELSCFAAALKNNSSIVSLQIRYVDVTHTSLIPLCQALLNHSGIRALDITGTSGGEITGRALRDLVCTNSNIIFTRLDDAIVSVEDSIIINEATQYNAMVCADPNNNPFQLGLLRKISAIEEEEQQFNKQLQSRQWFADDSNFTESRNKYETKIIKKPLTGNAKIRADVCSQYIQGQCVYGSRCKFFHPDRTTALKNAAVSREWMLMNSDHGVDSISSVAVTASSVNLRRRLQSRLRPPQFTLKDGHCRTVREPTPGAGSPEEDPSPGSLRVSELASLWVCSITVIACCSLIMKIV